MVLTLQIQRYEGDLSGQTWFTQLHYAGRAPKTPNVAVAAALWRPTTPPAAAAGRKPLSIQMRRWCLLILLPTAECHAPRLGRGGRGASLQKLTTLDSATRLANPIGSMKEAFRLFRSSSVTPRATEQAPQTYTLTLPATIFSINSERGGKPTAKTLLATTSLARYAASPMRTILTSFPPPSAPIAVTKGSVALVGSFVPSVPTARILAISISFSRYNMIVLPMTYSTTTRTFLSSPPLFLTRRFHILHLDSSDSETLRIGRRARLLPVRAPTRGHSAAARNEYQHYCFRMTKRKMGSPSSMSLHGYPRSPMSAGIVCRAG
jgi:hypothetical protein